MCVQLCSFVRLSESPSVEGVLLEAASDPTDFVSQLREMLKCLRGEIPVSRQNVSPLKTCVSPALKFPHFVPINFGSGFRSRER